MSYYIRFLVTDDREISLSIVNAGLKQKDLAYSIERDEEFDDEGEFTFDGDLYGQIEINRIGDDVFNDDIKNLKEFAEQADGERKAEVLQVLDESKAMLVIRVLWQGRETEETLEKITPLWEWLFANHKGLLKVEDAGYYNASELIFEVA